MPSQFATEFSKSNVVELVGEEFDGENLYQATLRVLDNKWWVQMMSMMLRDAAEGEGYDLEPRKSFYFDGENVRYHWVLLIWGDLDKALEEIGDILATRHEPKPPPPETSDPRMRPTKRHNLKRFNVGGEVIETRTLMKLPHARGDRYSGPEETVTLETAKGKFKARVRGRGEAEFDPRKESGEL